MSPVYPFDDATTARAVISDDGILVEWNGGARRLLGHTAADVVGRPAARLLAGDGVPAAPAGPRWHGTVGLRHRDGRTVSVWLLAHHRSPRAGRPGDWLVVTPLADDAPDTAHDPLTGAALDQSPCAIAVYDDRLRLCWMNDAMAGVIGLPEARLRGLRMSEIGGDLVSDDMEDALLDVLTGERPRDVRTHTRAGGEERAHAWLVRMAPVRDTDGRVRGVSVAAHDFTDNYLARERLQLVNEASIRIGSTLDVTRTAEELAAVCVPALADFVTIDLIDPHGHSGEIAPPVNAPVTLRRIAHRSVLPGDPEAVTEIGQLAVYAEFSPQADSLVSGRPVVGSLPSDRLTRWLAADQARALRSQEYGVHAIMIVPIQARGLTLGVAGLARHRSPGPFTPDDVLLAEEVTARAAVCIDNARRYSRERETAIALQRSLLPRTLPRTAVVQAASRYLPAARAGVGGDWFDVIPLSGMRVAMVVGDVVGHGIQASATMGRLRTAVRTLADIDLAPDELLTHLDDLVVRLSEESGEPGDEAGTGEVGATCLYAVYDPVSRRCTLARAGHPPPVLVPPGGTPRQLDLPAGPPLGLGGLPFESAEVKLPDGSLLALYTNGLISNRDWDAGAAQRLLLDALATRRGSAGPADSLDETCDRILRYLLPPDGVPDDVALLLAHTRGLPASQVAAWDIPVNPALVAPIRKKVVEQLDTWGLSGIAFTSELVVSELVTNAIRYGAHPIRLRLVHGTDNLICEVSDSSHTAPHLRRAKTWDEGGRGLLLVAQLTQRWGSRHTAEGKTIWAELTLAEE
ncbi:SpoIIE family protein phosphatase [Streptomyces sp. NPDC002514]|uniref:SpoIIE family protein phosphatase n=1 Tax=unclassified Streptomyces TaxID=2593676 RepID=UPI0036842215